MGTATPICVSRSLMCGTAAAASSRSTVTRTSSEPARASAAACRAVASTSAVSVLVIDWTTTGASPPTVTPATSTATDRRRFCGPASLMSGSLSEDRCQKSEGGRKPSVISPLSAAMAADTGDLDHRRLRREIGSARSGAQRACDLARRGFADRAATLADEKHHQRAGGVVVHAGDERVAALDAMHKAVLTQELERPIGGDRRRPQSSGRQTVDDLVGAERLVTGE